MLWERCKVDYHMQSALNSFQGLFSFGALFFFLIARGRVVLFRTVHPPVSAAKWIISVNLLHNFIHINHKLNKFLRGCSAVAAHYKTCLCSHSQRPFVYLFVCLFVCSLACLLVCWVWYGMVWPGPGYSTLSTWPAKTNDDGGAWGWDWSWSWSWSCWWSRSGGLLPSNRLYAICPFLWLCNFFVGLFIYAYYRDCYCWAGKTPQPKQTELYKK